jgi:hypothetical protein
MVESLLVKFQWKKQLEDQTLVHDMDNVENSFIHDDRWLIIGIKYFYINLYISCLTTLTFSLIFMIK